MPKVGAEVGTPDGRGIVASVNMLKLEVKVKIEDSNGGLTFKDFPVDEVKFKRNVQAEMEKEDETEEE